MTEPQRDPSRAVTRVVVAGCAAISQFGVGWRGIAAALIAASDSDGSNTSLAGIPAEAPLSNPKARNARKMMSRGAYLAAATLADLMRQVQWTDAQREGAGYFLGVGASGGSLDDVTALLDASLIPDTSSEDAASPVPSSRGNPVFSLPAFGEHGLAACNPLLAFQLMNNFTLAHGAIFEGLGGPNGALFSRGSGTTAALLEAVHAIRSGDCAHAVAGGADSATHPVTVAELSREGFVAAGAHPSEAAAVLALREANANANAAIAGCAIAGCAIANGHNRSVSATIADAAERTVAESGVATIDAIVVAAWGPPAVDTATLWARARFPSAKLVDTSPLGLTLAAGPALGWATALDLISSGLVRVLAIDVGVDGDAGAVMFTRVDEAQATEVMR